MPEEGVLGGWSVGVALRGASTLGGWWVGAGEERVS
jgi:hypothetical protein